MVLATQSVFEEFSSRSENAKLIIIGTMITLILALSLGFAAVYMPRKMHKVSIKDIYTIIGDKKGETKNNVQKKQRKEQKAL